MNEDCDGLNLTMYRSLARLSIDDLHFILNNSEKLENLPETVVSNVVYRLSLTIQTQDIWKADGYKWKNTKSMSYPQETPDFIKKYYSCINADKKQDSRCVKHVYISKQNNLDVIVCYIGNLDIATRCPHGNSKLTTSHLFEYTLSSTINQIDTLVKDMSGSKAYKHLIATNDGEDAPRNVAQCEYRRQKFLKQHRITNDEIKNLVLLSLDLNGYCKLLQIQPEMLVVLIHDQMREQFSRLVKTTKETLPLYYDTTFSLGEIYVSIVGYRHIMFVEQPIIPLAILFHDYKSKPTHDRFLQIFHHEVGEIGKHAVLITDGEQALKDAFHHYYPNTEQLRCWNHLGQNIKHNVKKHYLPFQETVDANEHHDEPDDENDDEHNTNSRSKKKREIISNMTDTITNLLRSSSKLEFTNQYNSLSQNWPSGFRTWFDNNLLATIDEIGGWTARGRHLFDEISGVTANPIESLNAVFKRWLAWKELALDSLAQMFYLVNGFYVNEVKRGFCGAGGYHLLPDYINSKTNRAFLSLVKSFSPDEAVKRMKNLLIKRQTSALESNDVPRPSEEQTSLSISGDDVDIAEDIEISNDDGHQTSDSSPSQAVSGTFRRETLTNNARANLLNEQDLVHFNTTSKVFTVRSLDQEVVHAVHMNDHKRLFRCSCPSLVQYCTHILAVKVYLGMPIEDTDDKINLGHERKRKRIDDKIKKSGRKRPRRCDKDKENNHTSPYFSSKNNNNPSTTGKPTTDNNPCSSVSLPINTLPLTSPFQNVSNFTPSSSTVTGSTPTLIKSVRFISPTHLTIVPSQQNQYMLIQPK